MNEGTDGRSDAEDAEAEASSTEDGDDEATGKNKAPKKKIRVALIKDNGKQNGKDNTKDTPGTRGNTTPGETATSGDDTGTTPSETGVENGNDSGEQAVTQSQQGSASGTGSGNEKTSGDNTGEAAGNRSGEGDGSGGRNRGKRNRSNRRGGGGGGGGGNKDRSLSINDLSNMNMKELRQFAGKMGISQDNLLSLKKQEVIFAVLKAHTESNGTIYAYGSLEILPDGYGFLRSPQNSYLPGPDDIYISPSQIRLFNLKTGDTVYGQIRPPKEGERFFAMLRVETVNFDNPSVAQTRIPFDNLTPLYPDERLDMEMPNGDITTRMINLFTPIGKGQRGLIVSPPRTGKTIVLQKIANAITTNTPDCYLIVLLIDERPEEVTDMQRNVDAEVVSS
ncbi:MAG: transcription termination factor Rho, partial [Spirochaetaceae bacterium]